MMNLNPALNDTRRVFDEAFARIGLAIVRLTIGTMFVCVFFGNLRKGAYTPGELRGPDQLLHQSQSLAGRVEGRHGIYGKPCRDGGSHASHDRDLTRNSTGHRSAHTPGGFCGVRVPRQPLGLGVGHVVDLGAAGSRNRINWAFNRTRGPNLGRRRLAGAAQAYFSVVVV